MPQRPDDGIESGIDKRGDPFSRTRLHLPSLPTVHYADSAAGNRGRRYRFRLCLDVAVHRGEPSMGFANYMGCPSLIALLLARRGLVRAGDDGPQVLAPSPDRCPVLVCQPVPWTH